MQGRPTVKGAGHRHELKTRLWMSCSTIHLMLRHVERRHTPHMPHPSWSINQLTFNGTNMKHVAAASSVKSRGVFFQLPCIHQWLKLPSLKSVSLAT